MNSISSCVKCGKCCINHTILLTFRDLREILFYYPNFNFQSIFCILEPSSDFKQIGLLNQYFHQIAVLDPESHILIHGYLALRFISNEEEDTRKCIFFESISKMCSIHSHKPYMCRAYPHILDENDCVIWDKGRCLHPWELNLEEKIIHKQFLKNALQSFLEFGKEIQDWNNFSEKKEITDLYIFLTRTRKKEI